jgi:PhnB protein
MPVDGPEFGELVADLQEHANRLPGTELAARCDHVRMQVDLQPELWVRDTAVAVTYFERAFGAVVEHRVGGPTDPDGVVQLSVGGAHFWLSGTSTSMGRLEAAAIGGATARFLLVVDDPRSVAEAAVTAGGALKSPVDEEHGWLVGRVVDPFGHEWEIGRPLGAWPPRA